jgi:hypothetical protein
MTQINCSIEKELDSEAVTEIRHAAVEKTTLTNIVFFVYKVLVTIKYLSIY